MKRTSIVGNMKVDSMQISSVIFVGDNQVVEPRTKALAVQRQVANFLGDEGDFKRYSIYRRPFPQIPLDTEVTMDIMNESPAIQVDQLRIVAMSTSAVVQIGSTSIIDAESRTKHFRQLLTGHIEKRPTSPYAVAQAFSLAPIVAREAFMDD